MRRTTFMLIATLIIVVAPRVRADVLTGPINDLPESSGPFYWGDGTNDLYQMWSTANAPSTGWFYASDYSWSNADIYVYAGLTDPTTISDATVFSYTTSGAVVAWEGDTVFFRGTNGYYGAWRLDDFYPSDDGSFPYSYLDAQWYFQDDGSGNFVPEPAAPPLDIKPGSCPNPFNLGSHGVLPVALISSENFDVTEIDVSSVLLSRADGVGGEVAPKEGPPGPHSVFEDVATPFEGEPCDCHDLSTDGIDDLSMKFRTDDLVEALDLNDLNNGDEVELVITGTLLDGTEFASAGDCVLIVPPGVANLAITSNVVDVYVDVVPADLNVDGGGFPAFERSYDPGTAITLTAPASADGRSFRAWKINGVLWTTGQTVIDVTIVEGLTARAVYRPPTMKDSDLGDHQGSPAPFER